MERATTHIREACAIRDNRMSGVTPGAIGLILFKILIQFLFMGAVLFVAAGTIHWTRGWIYMAIGILSLAVNAAVVVPKNPEAIIERHKNHADTKSFDKAVIRIIALVTVGIWIVSGLDAVRFRWSSLPPGCIYAGVLFHIVGMGLIGWCMRTNPFLEKTVRIQDDRGQRVVTAGPYRMVRHPMYLGMILIAGGYPLILGSIWSVVPVAVHTVLFILRAAYEDAVLRTELPGYADYTLTTRYRLLPGIW